MMMMAEPELREALFGSSKETAATAAEMVDSKGRWNDDSTNYSFQLDIPGVLAHNITIEELNGDIEVTAIRFDTTTGDIFKTYQDTFYLKPTEAILSDTTAILKDGVLTILVPKKKPEEPVQVEVESTSPPPSVAYVDKTEFRITVDLPGVKTDDITVQYGPSTDGKAVHLEARRLMDDGTIRYTRRTFDLGNQAATSNMALARAFLQDGIFTLVAPPIHGITDSESTADSTAMRMIAVTEENGHGQSVAPSAFAALRLSGEDGETNAMVVDTVSASEEKEWEQVTKKTTSD